MKIPSQSLLFLPIITASEFGAPKPPLRITHSSLKDGSINLVDVLSRDGLVSITSIPKFASLKRNMLQYFSECLQDKEGKSVTFADGTVRSSFALGADDGILNDLASTSSCEAFASNLVPFRSAVDAVVAAFARRLSEEMESFLMKPLLSGSMDANGNLLTWDDVGDVVSGGEFLEHFHSYQKFNADAEEQTIEFHVDQGFFLAFTPGLMMDLSAGDASGVSEGFYVCDSSGTEYELMLNEDDDLMFMLGDGVNQYINNKRNDDKSATTLYATPHALTLKSHQDPSISRVWYGRMILPPQDAYVPSSGDSITFGQMRSDIIAKLSTTENSLAGLGCSSPALEIGLHGTSSISRTLQESCAEDELFCWFRCMPLVDHELTMTTCSERNLQLQCTNPRDQVVPDGMQHGDFYPACTNSTDPVTDYPLIEQQDNLTCPDLWEDFVASDEVYDHVADVTVPSGPETTLMWSVTNEGKIKARLVHNNVFGWLSMGFADPNGAHNGMNGGQVLLASPYDTENYSPVTGLDNSTDAMIGTYVIDANDTAFRHWMYPIQTDEALATVADVESNECFTSISFESTHINGNEFNITGTDEMIWAGNSQDYFIGYHGPFSRMRFTVNWMSGDITPFAASGAVPTHDETVDNEVTVNIEDIASSINGDSTVDTEETKFPTTTVETKKDESAGSNNKVASAVFVLMANTFIMIVQH